MNCYNCAHRRLDAEDEENDDEGWEYCDRPNFPKGVNMLTSVQNKAGASENPILCGGKYFMANKNE